MARKTFLTILLTLTFFGVVNITVARWSKRLPARRKLEAVSQAVDANVLLVGNSLLDGKVDPVVFQTTARLASQDLLTLNAALGACEPPEQYLLFRQGMKHPLIRTVVIGFYDFQLTRATPTKASDLLGNRALAYDSRVSRQDAESIYHFDLGDRVEYTVFRALPMLAYRSNVWQYVEVMRRKLGAIGMPQEKTNEWGRVADFQELETDVVRFREESDRFASHPAGLNEPMERILNEAAMHGDRVILVLMPASPYHRTTFYSQPSWTRYVWALRALADQRGVGFIDASQWFLGEDDFTDRLHMKKTRKGVFSEQLARAVTAQMVALSLAELSRR